MWESYYQPSSCDGVGTSSRLVMVEVAVVQAPATWAEVEAAGNCGLMVFEERIRLLASLEGSW